MSLKVFHIVFIAASILLALVFGVWAVLQYFAQGGYLNLLFAAGAALAVVGLIFYGKYMLKKLKDMPYL